MNLGLIVPRYRKTDIEVIASNAHSDQHVSHRRLIRLSTIWFLLWQASSKPTETGASINLIDRTSVCNLLFVSSPTIPDGWQNANVTWTRTKGISRTELNCIGRPLCWVLIWKWSENTFDTSCSPLLIWTIAVNGVKLYYINRLTPLRLFFVWPCPISDVAIQCKQSWCFITCSKI